MNLSKHHLSEKEDVVLRKGLNFAPTAMKLPVIDVIVSVECALRHCDNVTEAEVARGKFAGVMRRSSSNLAAHRRNITAEKVEGLRSLKENEAIVVIPADKGNVTVVMH